MSAPKVRSATARLKQDYMRLHQDPVPYIVAEPLPNNILEWHYVVQGPENSPYEGGFYHGKLVFPREFPFKPPAIYMITPNGRFKTNVRLCLSISDYHPDTWNPAWSVSTILTGLLSFMLEKSPTLGSIESTDYDKRAFAEQSLRFNLQNNQFKELFPDIVKRMQEQLNKVDEAKRSEPAQEFETITNEQSISGLWNVVLLVGFAAFAYTVKYVMMSSSMGNDN